MTCYRHIKKFFAECLAKDDFDTTTLTQVYLQEWVMNRLYQPGRIEIQTDGTLTIDSKPISTYLYYAAYQHVQLEVWERNFRQSGGKIEYTSSGKVYVGVDTSLPPSALGWTQCKYRHGSTSTWLDKDDQERSKLDMEEIEQTINSIRTKDHGRKYMKFYGLAPCYKLKDMKLALKCAVMSQHWPMRDTTQA